MNSHKFPDLVGEYNNERKCATNDKSTFMEPHERVLLFITLLEFLANVTRIVLGNFQAYP